MAEKSVEESSSQSSYLDEEDLEKLVGNGGNNASSSSMDGCEVNVSLNWSSSSETHLV